MTLRIPAFAFRFVYTLMTGMAPDKAAPYGTTPKALQFSGSEGNTASAAALNSRPIPERIWTYWNAEIPDAMVRQCIDNWRAQCPGFEVLVLNGRNLADHVPAHDLPPTFSDLHPTKQSDWVRLYVVRHYGGYWLDATILLTGSLQWMDDAKQASQAEFTGFYLEGYTRDTAFPVIESWAFCAPAHSPFVTAWQEEFNRALIEKGTEAYLAEIRASEDGKALLQGIPDPAYLLIHVTAQKVLRNANAFQLALFKAEDTAFFYQKALHWKWYLLYPRLCLVPADARLAPLVKLRGGERRHFSQLFQEHGGPAPGSLWGRACSAFRPRQSI